MKISKLIWLGIVLIVIAVGWYIYNMSSTQPEVVPFGDLGISEPQSPDQTNSVKRDAPTTPAVTQTNTRAGDTPAILAVSSDVILGKYLVASNGMTLYMFTKDAPNVSNCYDACAANWPAYSPAGSEPVVPGDGIVGKLGSIARKDGTTQLTYNTMPLYFWHNDVKPGDTTGQNVGGVWFVVKP